VGTLVVACSGAVSTALGGVSLFGLYMHRLALVQVSAGWPMIT
jgi:hypothetical protein